MKKESFISDLKNHKFTLKQLIGLVIFTIIFIYAIFNMGDIKKVFSSVLGVLTPFLTGIGIAFILNIFVKLFEEKLFAPLNKKNSKYWNKLKRPVCILISLLLICVIVFLLLILIVPELIKSVQIIKDTLPDFINTSFININNLLVKYGIDPQIINSLKIDWTSLMTQITNATSDFLSVMINFTMVFTNGIVNFILSIIFALYMLSGKETLIHNLKSVISAFCSEKRANRINEIATLANKIFSGFVTGQMTEALIIGVLCYLGMILFRFPYALLISCVVAVSALVPIVGAYFGAFFGAFILLMENPILSVWFLVYLLILQNLEGNLIYPKVMGTSVGLPAIWVMFAIFVGGNLFGIIGVLLGVPTLSLIYALLKEETAKRLKQKQVLKSQEELTDEFLTEKILSTNITK